ncbi:MAG: helix-hairpin-helix domain-containing protein [Bacteroidetes bacterium]|nr:helix-hairpin-helix domain-containing protein [Bacteroidota bacterium]
MKRYQVIRDYLTFNRSEIRGIIVLLVILLLVATANQLLPEEHIVPSVNFPGLEKELLEFEAGIKTSESNDSISRINKFKSKWSLADKTGDSARGATYPARPLVRIDINKADTLELQRLKGIGPSYARRIVNYRNRLGGFINNRQLLEVWGVDTALYNLIREHLIVTSDSVIKLEINTISFKELLKHPYFPYEITRAIILYRQKNKIFRSVDELQLVEGVSDSAFRKIRPYVKIAK